MASPRDRGAGDRGESDTEKAKTRQVEVSLLGSSNKVVTNKQRFEFIQTEAMSERVLPMTLLLSIRDGDQSISDEQILTFDSTSPMLDERKRSMMLTLAAGRWPLAATSAPRTTFWSPAT